MPVLLRGLTVFAGAGGFLFGYNLGVIAGVLPLLRNDTNLALDDTMTELIVGQAKVGAALSALIGTWVLQTRGHVTVFWVAGLAFVAGPILVAAGSSHWVMVAAGRLLTGVALGLSAVASPTYLAEVTPARSRGFVISMYDLMLTMGALMAAGVNALLQVQEVVDWLDANRIANVVLEPWRIAFALPGLAALPYFLCSLCLPETPAFLAQRGQIDDALDLLRRLHGKAASASAASNAAFTSTSAATPTVQRLPSAAQLVPPHLSPSYQLPVPVRTPSAPRSISGARSIEGAEPPPRSPFTLPPLPPPPASPPNRPDVLQAASPPVLTSISPPASAPAASARGPGPSAPSSPPASPPSPLLQPQSPALPPRTFPNRMEYPEGRWDRGAASQVSPAQPSSSLISPHQPSSSRQASGSLPQPCCSSFPQPSSSSGFPQPSSSSSFPQPSSSGGFPQPSSSSGFPQPSSGGFHSRGHSRQSSRGLEPSWGDDTLMTGSPDVTVDGGQGSSLMRYTCASSNASMTELPLTASAERLQRLVEEEQQEELKLRCTTSRAADGEFTAWGCLIRRERFGFLLVLALAAVNQANGASSVLNYSTTLLMSSLFEVPVELAVTLSLLLLSTKLLGVIASLLLAGRCGRRMLVLAGALLTAGCLALAAGACAYGSLAGVLVGLFGFVLSYGLTLAPTLHLLLAELFSPTARPLGACLATALSFSAGAVVDLSLLSLVDALGWSIVLGLLGCVCLLGGLPVLLLPETCGRTLSEIQSLLAARRTSGSCHPCGGAEEGERTARLASPLYDAQGQDLTKRASSALALSL